jgi:membrane protein
VSGQFQERLGSWGHACFEFGRDCTRRAIEVEFVDRSIALAALTFTALIPLGVVIGSFVPGFEGRSLSSMLIDRFDLDESSAKLVEGLFAPASSIESGYSILGLILVIVSGLAFSRALQRIYEKCWRLRPLGVRATPAGLKWLAAVALYFGILAGLRGELVEAVGPVAAAVFAIAISTLIWLFTPTILLSKRVGWRELLPTAALTGIAMTVLSAASTIYMPESIANSAASYGQIGVAIAILSWLVTAGFTLVLSAVVGAVIAERFGFTGRIEPEPRRP